MLALVATLVAGNPSPLRAASYFTLEPYAPLPPLSNEELAELRGGFFDIFGASIEFGAEVRTSVNGELLFRTTFVQSADSLVPETVFVPDPTLDLSAQEGPITRPGLPSIVLVGGENQRVSAVVPGLSGLDSNEGIVLVDASGTTAALHQIGARILSNGIVNTASNRDVRQELDVTITMHNFPAFASTMRLAQLRVNIRNALAEAHSALSR